ALIVRVMKGIITLAELRNKAADLMGENPSQFSDTKDESAVIKRVDQINDNRHTVSVQLRADFDTGFDGFQKALDKLWTSVQPASPPKEIRSSFKLVKPSAP